MTGKLDTDCYIKLLETNVLPDYNAAYPCPLVHDHFPVHHAKKVRDFLADHHREIYAVNFPPASGDLHLMAIGWTKVIRELNHRTVLVSSANQLWEETVQLFEEIITPDFFNKENYRLQLSFDRVIELGGDALPIP